MAFNINVFDPQYWTFWFAGQDPGTGTTNTVQNWGLVNGASLCFNLALFNMSNGKSVNYVRTKKGIISYGGASATLKLDGSNECRGYSNAIVNNKISINAPLGGKALRNGIGWTVSKKLILAQTSHACTEKDFANGVLKDLKKRGEEVEIFVLQDGGGSTSEYSNISRLTYYPKERRKVATVFCVGKKNLPKITRVLNLGKRGEDVRLLQMVLGGIECDGIFGPGTYKRVRQAQAALGIKVDGSCGPQTLAALGLA